MEIFKDIVGYEGLYQVSNFGNVKSLSRGNGNGYRDRILKAYPFRNKYYRVRLAKNNVVETFQVHRLVASHFLDNHENKPFVNHKDNNGLNNKVSNLEWCTHSENMIHAQKQGRLFESQSKAGKAGGKTMHDKAVKKANESIGFMSGFYEVISFDSVKNRKVYVNCTCHGCNKNFSVYLYNIKNGNSTSCLSCRTKYKKMI